MTQQQLANNSLASKALASTALGLMSSSVGIPIGENVSSHSSCEQSPAPHPSLHSSGSGSGLSQLFSFKNALSAMTSGKSDKHKAPHTPPPPQPVDNTQLQSISLINQQQQQIALKNAQGIYKMCGFFF